MTKLDYIMFTITTLLLSKAVTILAIKKQKYFMWYYIMRYIYQINIRLPKGSSNF